MNPPVIAVLGERIVDFVPGADPQAYRAVAGGSPANVALGVRRLGGEPVLLGRAGDDGLAGLLDRAIADNGLSTAALLRRSGPSLLAVCTRQDDGSVSYYFYYQGSPDLLWDATDLGQALAAARAGRHVVVEKPLEITLERCDDIIQACDEAGVKLCTIFPSRFSPANLALKAALEGGRFGRVTLGDTYVKWWRTQEYYDGGGWRGTWALDGGGAFMNQAIHNVDLLCWLMGGVSEVAGYTGTLAHERIEVEDVGVACLKFQSGALGVMEATTAAWPGMLKRTEIHGSRGTAIVEQDSILKWEFAEPQAGDAELLSRLGGGSATTGGAADPKAISFVGHQLQLQDFVEAIAEGRAPQVDGREGRRSVEVILALYRAATTGTSVRL